MVWILFNAYIRKSKAMRTIVGGGSGRLSTAGRNVRIRERETQIASGKRQSISRRNI